MTTPLPFSEIVKVRFSDTDSQGHLYFANYLVYADEVAGYYMEALGFSAMNPQDAPCFIFTVNINCDYLDECKAFDDVRVEVGYSRLGNSSADVAFELYRAHDNVQLAKGSLTQVFVEKESRKAAGIPESFRKAIISRQPDLS
jgi:acyl-CoA thioester hydrolase